MIQWSQRVHPVMTRTTSAIASRVGPLKRSLLDFCYPGRCATCEADCAGSATLCPRCETELEQLERAASCPWCAMPLAQRGDPCPYCTGRGVPHYERIVRLGVFNDPVRHLIHQVKYHARWPLAEFLADRLFEQERVRGIFSETKPDESVLLPVPLHRLRQIARGFNQAEVIARRLRRHCHFRIARPVVRLKNTETQTHIHSRAERAENLRDAFGLVNPKSVAGKHVVVIDDVMTTGATLQSFARTLKPAKPASLCAIVVAIADPKHRDFEAI